MRESWVPTVEFYRSLAPLVILLSARQDVKAGSAKVVAQLWLRSIIARDFSFEEFKESVRNRRFRHPETGNEDLFQSLPAPEQARIFQQWKQQRQPQKERSDARGLIPIDRKKIREVSDGIAKTLADLKFRDPEESFRNNRTHPWPLRSHAIPFKNVQGQERWLPVHITIGDPKPHSWTVGRKYVTGGRVRHQTSHGRGERPTPYVVEITLSADRSPHELAKYHELVADEIYQVMIHELTHAADMLPTQHKKKKRDEEDKKKNLNEGQVYHNKEEEVRAFKRQIAEEVEKEISRRYKDEENPNWIDQNADTAMSLLQSSVTWDRIKRDLTPENRKSVLKTVADVLRRYKEQRGGQTG